MEYAVRLDSQATDQENCLLSDKYGLAKRPNTNFLAKVKSHAGFISFSDTDCVMHPISYGNDTRILVGFRGDTGNSAGAFADSTTAKWALFSEDGSYNVITHFPASAAAIQPAISKYPLLTEDPYTGVMLSPSDISFATIGDNTFINHAHVRPKMSTTTWTGYNEAYTGTSDATTRTCTNDEVFALWLKNHVAGKQTFGVNVTYEQPDGTLVETKETVQTSQDDSSVDEAFTSTSNVMNDTKVLAGILAYQLSAVDHLEATNRADFGDAPKDGDSVITGRLFDNTDPESQIGKLVSVKATAARNATGIYNAFKTVPSISALPPRSWEDHTLEVRDTDNDTNDVFYMRYVSDEVSSTTFENTANHPHAAGTGEGRAFGTKTAFGAGTTTLNSKTTKLPAEGHWEEHCGVGVQTTVDAATMPHVLHRRPDGSFIMMEARGDFQINTANDQVVFTGGSDDTVLIQLDTGFSDDGGTGVVAGTNPMAIIVGDTLSFSQNGGTGTFPIELEQNKEYFVISVTKNARAYTVKLSETEGGSAIEFSASAATLENCPTKIHTYSLESWADRQAGDDATNPLPDMFSRKINKIFTHNNRLGFVSDKEVYFSATGDPYSIFRTTVRDLIDDDPFGVSPSDSRGDAIKAAAGFGQNLVVFTNEAQHIVRSLDGKFAAKSVEIVAASHSTCDFDPLPFPMKGDLYYTYSTSSFGGAWQFAPSNVRNNTFDTTDISDQIPGFLPKGARVLTGSSKHRMLFYINDRPSTYDGSSNADITSHADYGKDQNIYVYKFTDGPNGRVQSAWTKWRLNADKETGHTSDANSATGYRILNAAVVSDRLYLVTGTRAIRTGGSGDYCYDICLEYIDLDMKTPDTLVASSIVTDFEATNSTTNPVVLLDRKTSNSATGLTESYNSGTNVTTITPPWAFDSQMMSSIEVVTSAGVRYTASSGLTMTAPTTSGLGTIAVAGVDLRSVDYYVGFGYTMSSTFGSFAPRIGDKAVRGRNIYVRGARLTYTMATEFTTKVTHAGTVYSDTVTADSAAKTTSGEMYFGLRKYMPEFSYTIENSNPFNAMFQGISYDMNIQEVMSRG